MNTFQEPSTSIDLKPAKTELAVCSTGGRVELFSLSEFTSRYLSGPPSGIIDIKYSTDGQILLGAYEAGKVAKWELRTGKTLALPSDWLVQRDGSNIGGTLSKLVSVAAINAQGDTVVFAPAEQRKIRLYSTSHGITEVKDAAQDAVALAFFSDGAHFVSGGWSCDLTLFRVGAPKMLGKLRVPIEINSVAGTATLGIVAVAGDKGIVLRRHTAWTNNSAF